MTRHRLLVLPVLLVVSLWSTPAEAAEIDGTDSGEALSGTDQRDLIRGLGGSDTIFAKSGNDTIVGGDGSDTLFLGAGKDTADGGDGGSSGNTIWDDDGRATATEKPDRIFGGAGEDTIFSADGEKDTIDCGAGTDDAAHVDRNDIVRNCETIIAFGGQFVSSSSSGEFFEGTRERDTITGTADGDIIVGKNGNDVLFGGDGTDLIFGGLGRDTLHSDGDGALLVDDDGAAGDRLIGGAENDSFFAADGAVTEIDCGLNDGFSDAGFVDAIDVLTNCGPNDNFLVVS